MMEYLDYSSTEVNKLFQLFRILDLISKWKKWIIHGFAIYFKKPAVDFSVRDNLFVVSGNSETKNIGAVLSDAELNNTTILILIALLQTPFLYCFYIHFCI